MRHVLDTVTNEWQPVIHVAADHEEDPRYPGRRTRRSREESVRRACKRLAEQGIVELGYQSMLTGMVWTDPEEQRQRLEEEVAAFRATRPPDDEGGGVNPNTGLQRARLVVRRTTERTS
jgi:hypothetical protein